MTFPVCRKTTSGSELCIRDAMQLLLPDVQIQIRRATLALCRTLAWAPVNEFTLTTASRRADIMALCQDDSFACIEIKSGPRDFLSDLKWPEYRVWCDRLYFAVSEDFPLSLLPDDVGIIVAAVGNLSSGIIGECAIVREATETRLAPARRRTLTRNFARTAALRLSGLEDPAITASLRATLRAD